MHILAGDIGATNTRLALFRFRSASALEPIRETTLASRSSAGLDDLLEEFLQQTPARPIERACFGVAGPVIDQTCHTTNLPWRISAQEIQDRFGFAKTLLINDLEANAWGLGELGDDDFHTLNAGRAVARENRSIISAGTGLGEAGITWNGDHYRPFASEGGHADFSPATPLEFELHQWLAKQYGHVSWERVVSGSGLEQLYAFLLQYRRQETPPWLAEQIRRLETAPAVSQAALEERDPLCIEALDLFITLYGREAGNHALKLMAKGGVYVGGGIAPRILPRLRSGPFLQAFFDKGRMRPLLEAMPVKVILNDRAALLGAARFASRH